MAHIKLFYKEGEGFGENRMPSIVYGRMIDEGYKPTKIEINFDVDMETGIATFYFQDEEEHNKDVVFNRNKPSITMLEKMMLKELKGIKILEVVE